MVNYLRGEFYKLFRRKYLYGCLILLLAGAALLVSGWIFTNSHGNDFDFSSGGGVAAAMMSMGLYLTVVVCDMVFSEQYKHNTLKNEVSYGVPRARIYLGKLLVQAVTGVVLALLVLGFYEALCYFTLLPSENAGETVRMVGYCIAVSSPQWLAILSVCNLCFFLLRSSTVAAFIGVGAILIPSNVLTLMGLLVNPVFGRVSDWMPDAIVSHAYQMVGDVRYLAVSWALGAAWVAVTTLIGLVVFRRKEIS